jgi:4-diphosphocytidyl-2-C-methyl-D-erythritol kinase
MARTVEVTAPAKVNLFLGVGGVRDDGYHDVVTVLHALELADRVIVTESEALSVSATDDLGVAEQDNLAYRAAIQLAAALEVSPTVGIHIEKRIPHGAGLGGGSSDAAAVIAALCALNGIDLSDPAVLAVAAAVGADVPFFLAGPAALMAGRGDVLVRLLPPVRVPVVVVKPAAPVPTAQAYREFDRSPVTAADVEPLVAALERGEIGAAAVSNNLAAAAVALVPESGDALALVASCAGVLVATVSGSGSAVFGVCADPESADATAGRAREQGWWAVATWTSCEGMTVARDRERR